MRLGTLRKAALGVAVTAAVSLVLVACGSRGSGDRGVSFDIVGGSSIEGFGLPVLQGDGSVGYGSFADRPLVINFFSSWCPSCAAELPEFEAVHGLIGDRVRFLGVSQSDARSASLALARAAGITFRTAVDRQGRFFRAVGGIGMPTTVFVQPGGVIVDVWIGPLDAEALLSLAAKHFGTPETFGPRHPPETLP